VGGGGGADVGVDDGDGGDCGGDACGGGDDGTGGALGRKRGGGSCDLAALAYTEGDRWTNISTE